MFDMILAKRFEGLPGSEMVRRKEYAIEEGSSSDGYELNRASELSATLRPGQKINMCMVFRDPAEDDVCPRCQTVARGSSGSRTQWFA